MQGCRPSLSTAWCITSAWNVLCASASLGFHCLVNPRWKGTGKFPAAWNIETELVGQLGSGVYIIQVLCACHANVAVYQRKPQELNVAAVQGAVANGRTTLRMCRFQRTRVAGV